MTEQLTMDILGVIIDMFPRISQHYDQIIERINETRKKYNNRELTFTKILINNTHYYIDSHCYIYDKYMNVCGVTQKLNIVGDDNIIMFSDLEQSILDLKIEN